MPTFSSYCVRTSIIEQLRTSKRSSSSLTQPVSQFIFLQKYFIWENQCSIELYWQYFCRKINWDTGCVKLLDDRFEVRSCSIILVRTQYEEKVGTLFYKIIFILKRKFTFTNMRIAFLVLKRYRLRFDIHLKLNEIKIQIWKTNNKVPF